MANLSSDLFNNPPVVVSETQIFSLTLRDYLAAQIFSEAIATEPTWVIALTPDLSPSASVWASAKPYTKGQYVVDTARTHRGMYFVATNDGTSGTDEPTWSYENGDTISDGTVVWKAVVSTTGSTSAAQDAAKRCFAFADAFIAARSQK